VPGEGFDGIILQLCAQHAMVVGQLATTVMRPIVRRVGTTPYVNTLVLGSALPLDFAGLSPMRANAARSTISAFVPEQKAALKEA
jgi:hypothetical protein